MHSLKYPYMVCGCKEHCVPVFEEAAKISSSIVTSVYPEKGQFFHWQRTACMISSIEKVCRQSICARLVQVHRRKCGKQSRNLNKSITVKQKKYRNKYFLKSESKPSKCLISTERSLINFTDTKCPS